MVIITCCLICYVMQLERFYKTTFAGADPFGLSAIEPVCYRDRFMKKIEDILDFDDSVPHGQRLVSIASAATDSESL